MERAVLLAAAPPDAEVKPVLLHTFDELTTGIAELEPDLFVVLTNNGYLDFSAFEGSWSAFVSERLAYFRLKRTKSIAPVATAAR